ncbi:hypothetical protein D9615_009438 [Tricholomella constricta]|uniref:Uncharacterized protein n=1 Tax=Tricholomella constricta TaxID=117010 RepID=A0A8H5LXY3_9AGAR|nr:hypothetical protein D9615_009438 [Tricholomella constricta]
MYTMNPAYMQIMFKPRGESIIAAGTWCPGRAELANLRTNIQNSSARLRRVLSAPAFVEHFGAPTPSREDGGVGARQSVFGADDELKVAPKGVDKSHPDIDLLKCRSFSVVHRFSDEEVLAPDFKEKLGALMRIMRPFVHCLNDMMTVNAGGGGDGDGSGSDGPDEEDEDEDADEDE